MKTNTLRHLLPILTTLLLASCSGQGPDVVDPDTGSHNQLGLIAIENDNGGELVRYNRSRGIENPTEYTSANSAPLGMSVDAVYESSYDKIYLHHRAEGMMTVLDVRTRRKITEISGFLPSADSGLNGMAFSNLSQGWAIAYGMKKLYHIDAVTLSVVDRQTVDLPGRPTSIATGGTSSTAVFVGMQMDDGSGQVGILQSNAGGLFAIERTLNFRTPIIYMALDPDGANLILVSAGADATGSSPAIPPRIHAVRLGSYEIDYERDIEAPSLQRYIGMPPTFAGISKEAFLYLAVGDRVLRLDVRASGQGGAYYNGLSDVIGVDYWSDYLYIYNRDEKAVVPISNEAQELDHVAMPGTVNAIYFITPSKVR
jgi:hypothetical protein